MTLKKSVLHLSYSFPYTHEILPQNSNLRSTKEMIQPPPPQLTYKWTFCLQKCISIYHYIPRSIVLLAGGRVTGGRIHLGKRSILPRPYLFVCALTIVLSTFQQRVYWWSQMSRSCTVKTLAKHFCLEEDTGSY